MGNGKNIILVLLLSCLSAQWHEQTNGLLQQNFTGSAIDAVNENIAVVAILTDSSHLYITPNGGSQWDLIRSTYLEWIVDVSIIDENNIWFCTAYPASIFHSNDGGETWDVQFSDTTLTPFLNYIEMFDENNGIAMGDALDLGAGPAVFLKTTNGGADWISVNDSAFGGSSGDIWRRIDFIDINTGYFRESGVTPNLLFKTTDGCATWTSTSFPQNSGHVLKFYNENIGLAINYRTYHRTFDGGLTWEESDRPDTNDPNWGIDVEYHPSDPSKVWFAGDQVFFSSDSGVTWNAEFSNSGIRDMVFIDENTCWILTDSGVFHKGELFIGDENLIPQNFKLHKPYPNPFNPTTTIRFTVAPNNKTSLWIFDITGGLVDELVSGELVSGVHEIIWNASNLSSGVYFVRLQSGEFVENQKVLLIK